jgi:hypothetical protein
MKSIFEIFKKIILYGFSTEKSLKTTKAFRKKAFENISCDLEGIRTPNHQSRNLIFYPVELRGHFIFDKYIIFLHNKGNLLRV